MANVAQGTAVNLDELEDTIDRGNPIGDTEDPSLNVGKLTAQSVVNDYTSTAQNITKVAEELGLVANRCEALLHELHDVSKVLNDAADNFRNRGKDIADSLERSARNTQSVREAAKEWLEKISETSP